MHAIENGLTVFGAHSETIKQLTGAVYGNSRMTLHKSTSMKTTPIEANSRYQSAQKKRAALFNLEGRFDSGQLVYHDNR